MAEILYLNYNPVTADWILRLQSRLQDSESQILKHRYSQWKASGLYELAMAFSTRLILRYRAALFFSKLIQQLQNEINGSGQLDELLDGGYAYDSKEHGVFYDICVALDALYFESRSAYEIVGKFVRTFGKAILNCNFTEQKIMKVLEGAGQEIQWVEHIRENRILFFHGTAPWIALRIHKRQPLECSLVIMKENLRNFDDSRKFITQEQLFDAWNGFERSIPIIFDWLKNQIVEFESKEISTTS